MGPRGAASAAAGGPTAATLTRQTAKRDMPIKRPATPKVAVSEQAELIGGRHLRLGDRAHLGLDGHLDDDRLRLRRRGLREQRWEAREVLAQDLEHPRRVQRRGGVVER